MLTELVFNLKNVTTENLKFRTGLQRPACRLAFKLFWAIQNHARDCFQACVQSSLKWLCCFIGI